jgi:hypothetical protein
MPLGGLNEQLIVLIRQASWPLFQYRGVRSVVLGLSPRLARGKRTGGGRLWPRRVALFNFGPPGP